MARTLRRECPKVRAMARIDRPSRCARRILAKSSTVSILASVPRVPWATGPIGTDAAGVGPFYLPIPGRGVGPFCAPITTSAMTSLPDRTTFESASTGQAPWDIDKPQQAFLDVAD